MLIAAEHKRAYPDITEDLFEAFDLTGIASEVARTLPNGAKNAIRKTYKGHIKKLGVNGHFDSVKREVNAEDSFIRLVFEPADSWTARQVTAKEIGRGLPAEVQSHLRAAMTMARGPIPKSEWDSSVLGDLAADKVAGVVKPPASGKATAPGTPLHPAVSRPKVQQPLAQEAARPRRSIMKRSYGDSSFEGYGETFGDDDGGLDGGSSTGEGDDRSAAQKRRKKVLAGLSCRDEPLADALQNPGPSQFTAGQVRQQSYGPGMVGA